ncbi:TIGR01777 family oxidoreductase [Thiomicrorhabdus sp.]|uniref:TIGR01777 family oxidoreductase n=1 Tax=Thiomicrorhabdus sp. TaxID=2039724 RepID=UPI003564494E
MNVKLDIVILGGTGFIGGHLSSRLTTLGHRVKVFGRTAFRSVDSLAELISGCDLLIMLAGANVGQRWSKAHKQQVWNSRILTNQMLMEALLVCKQPPQRIFSASGVGLYPQSDYSHPLDESCFQIGDNSLGRLGLAWEEASQALQPAPVIFRFGVVLGTNGGALSKMLPAFKLGLGGPIADGRQSFSWIHIDDLVNAFVFAIDHPEMEGAYNLVAPQPLSNAAFGRILAKVLKRPFWLSLPDWLLRYILGEGAQVLTLSIAVFPKRLSEIGFEFRYPDAKSALSDLLKRG